MVPIKQLREASPTLPLPPPFTDGLEHLAAKRPTVVTHREERRVPPECATLITVQVKPQSVCYLYHPKAPERRIQIDADNRGIVRFNARALKGAEPTEFHLESHHAGRADLHAISLTADIRHTSAMSAPELVNAPVVTGALRPPLEGDPMALPNAELVARGYPPRPDPEKSPGQYSRWLKNVSRSLTMIDTRLVAHPDYNRSKGQEGPPGHAVTKGAAPNLAGSKANINFYNWTGAYLTHPTAQFFSISAEWNTPLVFALQGGPAFSAMVEWIGLDNNAGDLYQSGTGSECYNILLWEITTYFMWMEMLPWSWWVVPNFPVSPGDRIIVDIWVANQFGDTIYQDVAWGGLTPQDNSVWFYLTNASNGASFMGTYPTAAQSQDGQSSTGFTGKTAEFILERPTINGSYTDLAFYFPPALMTSCSYGDSQYGDFPIFSVPIDGGPQPFDATLQYVNMIDPNNNNQLLAFPFSIPDGSTQDAQAIQFFWVNYQ
jgi:hypothetical protein